MGRKAVQNLPHWHKNEKHTKFATKFLVKRWELAHQCNPATSRSIQCSHASKLDVSVPTRIYLKKTFAQQWKSEKDGFLRFIFPSTKGKFTHYKGHPAFSLSKATELTIHSRVCSNSVKANALSLPCPVYADRGAANRICFTRFLRKN